MSIFSSQKKEKIVAIFDIGSGSVGGALARISRDVHTPPVIVAAVRTDITVPPRLEFDSFLHAMLSALDASAQALYKKNAGAPDRIFCMLASPWHLSEARVIALSKEKPFVFSSRSADDLLKKELSVLEKMYMEKYPAIESAPILIEHHITHVKLNGYDVSAPLGRKTKSLEMNMIISLSPKICIDKIKDTISKTFHDISGTFASFMTASYLVVRDTFSHSDSYLLVDVGGEITDVGVVSKGVLQSSLSFPFGKNAFFRQMSAALTSEPRDARELFSLFIAGHLSPDRLRVLAPILESIASSWSTAFSAAARALPRSLGFPDTIFLTADADVVEWFAGILRTDARIQPLLATHGCTVTILHGSEFLGTCSTNDAPADPFLMIGVLAAMKKINTRTPLYA